MKKIIALKYISGAILQIILMSLFPDYTFLTSWQYYTIVFCIVLFGACYATEVEFKTREEYEK
jgi:hypothetical protein